MFVTTNLVNFKKSLSELYFCFPGKKEYYQMIPKARFILKNYSLFDSVLQKWLFRQIATCFCFLKQSFELNSQLNQGTIVLTFLSDSHNYRA